MSVDQLVSAQPGLIPQTSGWLTSARVWAVTVFVDHSVDKIYTYLMTSTSDDETLAAQIQHDLKVLE